MPHGHTCALALDLPAYGSQVSLLPHDRPVLWAIVADLLRAGVQTELHLMLYKALELMNHYDTGLYD